MIMKSGHLRKGRMLTPAVIRFVAVLDFGENHDLMAITQLNVPMITRFICACNQLSGFSCTQPNPSNCGSYRLDMSLIKDKQSGTGASICLSGFWLWSYLICPCCGSDHPFLICPCCGFWLVSNFTFGCSSVI